jgi:hypothetical protein
MIVVAAVAAPSVVQLVAAALLRVVVVAVALPLAGVAVALQLRVDPIVHRLDDSFSAWLVLKVAVRQRAVAMPPRTPRTRLVVPPMAAAVPQRAVVVPHVGPTPVGGAGCCGTTATNGWHGHASTVGTYDPMFQHYRAMIPMANPGEPGDVEVPFFDDDDVVGILSNGVLLQSHKPTWS